jgi:hypothetical protein
MPSNCFALFHGVITLMERLTGNFIERKEVRREGCSLHCLIQDHLSNFFWTHQGRGNSYQKSSSRHEIFEQMGLIQF